MEATWVHDQCYDVECSWNIVANTFLGNTDGIRCLRILPTAATATCTTSGFIAAGSDKFFVN